MGLGLLEQIDHVLNGPGEGETVGFGKGLLEGPVLADQFEYLTNAGDGIGRVMANAQVLDEEQAEAFHGGDVLLVVVRVGE